jgi:type I restriction enzyme S subunit
MSLAKYDRYKPSGIDWLGEIPEHWETNRIKSIFNQISVKGSSLEQNTYVPLENIQSFTGKLLFRSSNDNGEETVLFKKDDILFNKLRPYLGKVIHAEFDGGVSGEVVVYRTQNNSKKNTSNKYFFYRLLASRFIFKVNSMTDGVKMPRTNPGKISAIELAIPPLSEQTTIAFYLDSKTFAIDLKVDLLEQKIIHYQQLRKSLINKTVCRGLDKNVKLKDSGIEWIGMIPEHWEVRRLKDIGKAIIGITYSPNDIVHSEKEGILVLRSSNIQNDKLDFGDCVFVNMKIPKKLATKVGDILICSRNGSRNLIGKNICIDEESAGLTFGAFMTIIRTKSFRYVSCFFNSQIFDAQSGAFMTSTINQLTINTLNNLSIALPSAIVEQNAIANYLDEKTQKIDSIVTNIKSQIETLKELRKTLINDVVTGKIKVIQ